MASAVSNVNSNAAASSLYGNRNVISGLASGMDTESMIENAVSGIRARITRLEQTRTMQEWKQGAMRDIISKMVGFSNKYTSFNSSTNLFSSSFFTNAVTTSSNGSNASKVSATGKTSSQITIDSVTKLAKAARHTVGGDAFGVPSNGVPTITGGKNLNLSEDMDISTITGSMTLKYGNKNVSIDFGELDTYKNATELKKGIEEKLANQTITLSTGEVVKASERINVTLDDATGKISFSDKSDAGNSVVVSGATGDFQTKFGLEDASEDKPGSITAPSSMTDTVHTGAYLSEKEIKVTLDGKTKTIRLPKYPNAIQLGETQESAFAKGINDAMADAFGADKINVAISADGKLQFTGQKGSTIGINSVVGEKLGIGSIATSGVDISKKLGDIPGMLQGLSSSTIAAVGTPKEKDGKFYDEEGNYVIKQQDGKFVRADEDGNAIQTYEFKLNGKVIGNYTKDTALDKVISDINNNTEAGVKINYSKTTNQFQFEAKETGANGKINFDSDLAKKMFEGAKNAQGEPAGFTAGEDAELSMTVNGETMTVKRSDNTFDVDGLKITLNGEFDSTKVDGGDKVSFTSKSDGDKIVTAVKDMVKDYNEMMTAIKEQYAKLPATKSDGSKYQPLTDSDLSSMSESAIKAYEEKAKQGILFGDSDLSSLYSKMASIFSSSGADGTALRAMGITTEYSATDGTTVKLDETKLRAMLDTNPDAVKDAFVKSKENGAPTNGVMQNLKTQLDNYAKTTGDKGVLINRAGSPLAPTSINENSMQKELLNIDKQIERWQTKLSGKVDLYTRQFTQLEQLIAQMNSQSSSLMSLMGGAG